jgi:hypothetical protein
MSSLTYFKKKLLPLLRNWLRPLGKREETLVKQIRMQFNNPHVS